MQAPTIALPALNETSLPRCLFFAAILTAFADLLFYEEPLGASVGVFALITSATLLLNRRISTADPVLFAILFLIPPAALQSMIEISFSNLLVLSALLIALAGQTFYVRMPQAWMRWLEALLSLLKSLGQWVWVTEELQKTERGFFKTILWWIRAAVPAILLTGLFTLLLSFGNVIFGHWVETTWDTIIRDIVFPRFSRIVLWVSAATLSLAILHPALAPAARKIWFGRPPIALQPDAISLNSLRSILILAVLNILFLCANTIDAVYLWTEAKLPADVTYAQFVHNGVYNLIACVIVSAIVLTVLFDQSREVTGRRCTVALGILWIVQNVFLITSVALRLKLYVDEYTLSTQRVYVMCFLLLVCTGFALLATKILAKKSSNWLVLNNALATFALFYTIQFLNVNGWVADYNVTRWIQSNTHPLDVAYLVELGPPAWPALREAAGDSRDLPEAAGARKALEAALASEDNATATRSWKSWQWRRAAIHQELVTQ